MKLVIRNSVMKLGNVPARRMNRREFAMVTIVITTKISSTKRFDACARQPRRSQHEADVLRKKVR